LYGLGRKRAFLPNTNYSNPSGNWGSYNHQKQADAALACATNTAKKAIAEANEIIIFFFNGFTSST